MCQWTNIFKGEIICVVGVYGRCAVLGLRSWNMLPLYDLGPEGPERCSDFRFGDWEAGSFFQFSFSNQLPGLEKPCDSSKPVKEFLVACTKRRPLLLR